MQHIHQHCIQVLGSITQCMSKADIKQTSYKVKGVGRDYLTVQCIRFSSTGTWQNNGNTIWKKKKEVCYNQVTTTKIAAIGIHIKTDSLPVGVHYKKEVWQLAIWFFTAIYRKGQICSAQNTWATKKKKCQEEPPHKWHYIQNMWKTALAKKDQGWQMNAHRKE